MSWCRCSEEKHGEERAVYGVITSPFGQGSPHWEGDARAKLWLRANMLNWKMETWHKETGRAKTLKESTPWVCAEQQGGGQSVWSEWVVCGGDAIPEVLQRDRIREEPGEWAISPLWLWLRGSYIDGGGFCTVMLWSDLKKNLIMENCIFKSRPLWRYNKPNVGLQ